MKRGRKARRRALSTGLGTSFARGFVATGLLAAIQDRTIRPGGIRERRRALRFALQGGTALAAGSTVADALQTRDWGLALTAVAAGGVGMLAIERWLQDDNFKENPDGQEET